MWRSTYAHKTAQASGIGAPNCACKSGAKKTLEVVLSNSMSMKAEVDFMHAIKHLEMALATSVAGAMVFTGMCCCLYLSSTKLCR